ncbi:Uncharacterised protein [Streptococcus pseudoporcinus]|uniref:Uncharacterized protein n=1 Tax=Streptococcus pseudoporcinus TaxID=361101 RepID=A0A4U9YF71_9STRE|nr:Uncharacterised protein [Streptococcus pseudoporcinus]VUC71552.1 Uncharacterised protein [Streptococcus pseudoporcinus]VUD00889.1 Uncharacterised protein [Streptococcus pseudoporcinus]VUD01195.1 Uncharacterised protein [Streptococcus pseudoporcinus]
MSFVRFLGFIYQLEELWQGISKINIFLSQPHLALNVYLLKMIIKIFEDVAPFLSKKKIGSFRDNCKASKLLEGYCNTVSKPFQGKEKG